MKKILFALVLAAPLIAVAPVAHADGCTSFSTPWGGNTSCTDAQGNTTTCNSVYFFGFSQSNCDYGRP